MIGAVSFLLQAIVVMILGALALTIAVLIVTAIVSVVQNFRN